MKHKVKIKVQRPTWAAIIRLGGIFLNGLFVNLVWNAIFPDLFGVPPVSYWQSVGIIFLAHIIIPSFSLFQWFEVEIE